MTYKLDLHTVFLRTCGIFQNVDEWRIGINGIGNQEIYFYTLQIIGSALWRENDHTE